MSADIPLPDTGQPQTPAGPASSPAEPSVPRGTRSPALPGFLPSGLLLSHGDISPRYWVLLFTDLLSRITRFASGQRKRDVIPKAYYANHDERSRLIDGLRAIAQFLHAHPDIPAPDE